VNTAMQFLTANKREFGLKRSIHPDPFCHKDHKVAGTEAEDVFSLRSQRPRR